MKSNLSSRQIHHLERRNTDACCSLICYLCRAACHRDPGIDHTRYRLGSPFRFDPSFTVGAKYLIRAMFGGLDSFPLLAVPMFVLSGIIMAKGGISKKLFDVFAFFLGNFTAGMPCAVIVTCLFYGAISGSAPATVAAVGSMTIPILSALGYDRTFSTAIVAVAGGLGVIIPPSIPFIMYGMASGASVSSLFLAGVIPGLMIGLLLMLYAIYHCRRYGEDREKSMLKSICCTKKGCSGCCAKAFSLS